MAITGKFGQFKIDGATLAECTNVSFADNSAVLTAEQAFGESFAPQLPGGLSSSINVSFRYSAAAYATVRANIIAQTAHVVIVSPSATAGDNVLTGNAYFSNLTMPYSAGGVVVCTVTLSNSDGTGFVVTPNIVLTPAAGALAAQVGVSATIATFAAAGGTAAYAYTMTGFIPGISLGSANGVLNGTPAAGVQGTYLLEVTATDANSVTKTQRYTVVVAAA